MAALRLALFGEESEDADAALQNLSELAIFQHLRIEALAEEAQRGKGRR